MTDTWELRVLFAWHHLLRYYSGRYQSVGISPGPGQDIRLPYEAY